jgi:hypothetical protein
MSPYEYDPAEVGTCDICNQMYVLGGDEHNTETGNHHECEGSQQ